MYDPLFNPSRSITNKVDAMQFAIIATMEQKCGEPDRIRYDEAKKLFDFICENVEFPADVNKMMVEELHQVVNALKDSQTDKSKSWLDAFAKLHDAPLAEAVFANADLSSLDPAIFRPKIREGQWYCNKVNPPYKDLPMAVVDITDECSIERTYYLARYDNESKAWRDFNTGQIIENVLSYYPVHYCLTKGLA